MHAGLLGRKLAHSLSPTIHRLFGDYKYCLYEREESDIEAFLRESEDKFLNVTIPYKRRVAELCTSLSPIASKLKNVNFVYRNNQGELVGDNTDYFGFKSLLAAIDFSVKGKVASVLGSGGAALTVKAVLEDSGASEVYLVVRNEEPSADSKLIVNATPVGMYPDVAGVRLDIAKYPNTEAVLDLVYNPSPTRLVCEARKCGKVAEDGMVMLIAQAMRSAELAKLIKPKRVYLYGAPASGKSTYLRAIKNSTNFKVIDLDSEIEAREGMTIPEIFKAKGEASFRSIEKAMFFEFANAPVKESVVVALGGGTLLDNESQLKAKESGEVILLEADKDTLWERASKNTNRPLAMTKEKFFQLLKAREEHYAAFRI